MKDKPSVAVVIPVYNVERYVNKCIESVVGQSYKNIEIVLVDDGSTDASSRMCDEWSNKDSRILVIHKKNEGLNYARRDGFLKTTSKYVTFLDSDDFLAERTIETTLDEIMSKKADVVVFSHVAFSDIQEASGEMPSSNNSSEVYTLSSKPNIVQYSLLGRHDEGEDALYMTVWGKLYKREVVEGVNWSVSNFRAFEDNFWTPQAISASDKVVVMLRSGIYYRLNRKPGTMRKTLGGKLVGNTIDGKPVGYLEIVDLIYEFHKSIAKKYKINLDDELRETRYASMWWRVGNLISSGLLGEENNQEYLRDTWQEHKKRDDKNANIINFQADEMKHIKEELTKLNGIKYTTRHLINTIINRIAHKK